MSEIKSPLKSIRAKCLECSNNSAYEVKLCTVTGCALHPFRFGKSAHLPKRELTPEQREILSARMKAMLEKQKQKIAA